MNGGGDPSHQPSYYLIPASAGFMQPPGQQWLPPPGSPMSTGFPPLSSLMAAANGGAFGGPSPPMSAGMAEPSPMIDTPWPKGAVVKPSPKCPRPQRVPGKNQFRHEIIIRNADSGKIMGVKGRRVAVVEELSNTVISFQKVASGQKDRGLTITGNTEEVIEHARLLIEETIRRNVSPNRPDGAIAEADEGQDDEDDGAGIKFEKADDGSVRMSCDDPHMLEAAQNALSQFFVRRAPNRRSGVDSERRKSVPDFGEDDTVTATNDSTSVDDSATAAPVASKNGQSNNKQNTVSEADATPNWRAMAKSTPNLSGSGAVPTTTVDKFDGLDGNPVQLVRAVYTRDYVLQCADSPASRVAPPQWRAPADIARLPPQVAPN